jgi:hypothetical protein
MGIGMKNGWGEEKKYVVDEDLHDEDGYIRDVTRRGGKGGRARQLSAAMIGGRRSVRAKAEGNLGKSKLNNRRGKGGLSD